MREQRPYWWRDDDLPRRERRGRARYVGAPQQRDIYVDDDDDDHHRDGYRDDGDYHDDGRRSWADKAADEVKSWFGSERAEHRRDMDHAREDRDERARRRDYRGVGPLTRHDEDEDLRNQICRRLADDPALDASGILVRVIDNEAILDGAVDSERDGERAYQLALDVPGIVHVRDRLSHHRRQEDSVRRATIGMGYDDSGRRRRWS